MKTSLNRLLIFTTASILLAFAVACTSSGSEPASNSEPETAIEGDFLATAQSIASKSAIRDSVVNGADTPRTYSLSLPSRHETADSRLDSPNASLQTGAMTEPSDDHAPVTQSEVLLTDIWNSTIDGVVLITTGTNLRTFFPTGGSGAGWFWDKQGHIVTNYHVVQPALRLGQPINVSTYSGTEYEAEYIGGDQRSDIAVLKVDADPEDYVALTTGDSSSLVPGMMAIALGHPFGAGQAFSMTRGIVSGLSRSIQSRDRAFETPGVIQTDADINPGNSGGPLLNSSGQVIGVNTQIYSYNSTNSGVGFAVPVNLVKRVVPDLIETGRHEYSVMGISMLWLTPQWRDQLGLPDHQKGAYISRISPTGPAEKAGLRGDSGTRELVGDGDIIIAINGVAINDADDLRQYLVLQTEPGDDIVVEIIRDGEVAAIPLTLASLNPPVQ